MKRREEELECAVHGVGDFHIPELALIFKGPLVLPDLQDDLQRLLGHLPVLVIGPVHVEHGPIGGQAAGADTEHKSSLGDVVQVGYPVRQFGGMMKG